MSPRNRWGWRYRLRNKVRYWRSRWPVASLLNRLPRTCWSELVDWAMHDTETHDALCVIPGEENEDECYYRLRNSLNGGAYCQAQSAMHRDLGCYCGKFINGCYGKAAAAEMERMRAEAEDADEYPEVVS